MLDWWGEAGVDLQFSDTASSWLQDPAENSGDGGSLQGAAQSAPQAAKAPAQARKTAAQAEPEQSPYPNKADCPQNLADFAPWWLCEPSLDAGGAHPRVAPRGPENAELMVLVPEPEADDRDRLLSGPHGRFLDAMLGAMKIAPEEAYIASALPRHTPLADWDRLAAQGMGAILRHHIALAAPRRLILLGQSVLPLLGHDTAQRPAHSAFLNHGDTRIPVFAGWDIGSLLGRARARSGLWQKWLDWTAPDRQG